MREKRSGWALAGAGLISLVALLGLYLGAYYGNLAGVAFATEESTTGTVWFRRVPEYRFLSPISAIVFYPVHQMDRRLRPDVWEIPPTY